MAYIHNMYVLCIMYVCIMFCVIDTWYRDVENLECFFERKGNECDDNVANGIDCGGETWHKNMLFNGNIEYKYYLATHIFWKQWCLLFSDLIYICADGEVDGSKQQQNGKTKTVAVRVVSFSLFLICIQYNKCGREWKTARKLR